MGVLWGCCGGGGWVGWWAGRAVGMVGPWKVGLKGWGPEGVGAQNFALSFLSPAGNFILSSLSGGSSR